MMNGWRDDRMNRYCVDVHWDVAKVFYDIEAASPEEAEKIVAEKCRELTRADARSCIRKMVELGFEPLGDYEVEASGKDGEDGAYEFGDL